MSCWDLPSQYWRGHITNVWIKPDSLRGLKIWKKGILFRCWVSPYSYTEPAPAERRSSGSFALYKDTHYLIHLSEGALHAHTLWCSHALLCPSVTLVFLSSVIHRHLLLPSLLLKASSLHSPSFFCVMLFVAPGYFPPFYLYYFVKDTLKRWLLHTKWLATAAFSCLDLVELNTLNNKLDLGTQTTNKHGQLLGSNLAHSSKIYTRGGSEKRLKVHRWYKLAH